LQHQHRQLQEPRQRARDDQAERNTEGDERRDEEQGRGGRIRPSAIAKNAGIADTSQVPHPATVSHRSVRISNAL
jgi:hypothetical protein